MWSLQAAIGLNHPPGGVYCRAALRVTFTEYPLVCLDPAVADWAVMRKTPWCGACLGLCALPRRQLARVSAVLA